LTRLPLSFLAEHAVVDRIIRHLELTFVAEKPPPADVFEQLALMGAEESGEFLTPIWGRDILTLCGEGLILSLKPTISSSPP